MGITRIFDRKDILKERKLKFKHLRSVGFNRKNAKKHLNDDKA